jgi:hypothetical protein
MVFFRLDGVDRLPRYPSFWASSACVQLSGARKSRTLFFTDTSAWRCPAPTPTAGSAEAPPVHVEAGQSAFCWKAQVRVIRQMARKLNATASSWIRRCSSSSPRNIRINAQRAKAKTDGMREGKRYRIPAACVRGLATSTWKPEPSPRRRSSNPRIPSGSVSHWRPWNSPSQACFPSMSRVLSRAAERSRERKEDALRSRGKRRESKVLIENGVDLKVDSEKVPVRNFPFVLQAYCFSPKRSDIAAVVESQA